MKSINQSIQNLIKKGWLAIRKLKAGRLVAAIVIIIAILAGIGVYYRQRLVNAFLHLQQQITTIQNELSECQQRVKIYTIYPGPEYTNEKYGFTMSILKDWFVIEHHEIYDNKRSKIQVITFANSSYTNAFRFNPSDWSMGTLPLLFSLWIIPRDDKDNFKVYEERRGNLEEAFSEGIIEKTEYEAAKDKVLSLYLILIKDDNWDITWDKILPDVEAFVENESYLYYFATPAYIPLEKERKELEVEVLQKSLASFKFK